MSKIVANWQYTQQYPVASTAMTKAYEVAHELGVKSVCPATAAALTSLAVLTQAENICELGTGVGVSGLALLQMRPQAQLTSVDIEGEYHREARGVFAAANIAPARLRLIEGDAAKVLPRLNTNAYDLLLVDANPDGLLAYVEYGLQVVKPGGSIVIPNALRNGQVPDPTARDQVTAGFRELLELMRTADGVYTHLASIGDGLLTITRLLADQKH